jgi:enamine deaminase RidA (YjgF/YER057c/UK114 family)
MEIHALNPGDWQDPFDFSQAIEVRGAERVVYCAGQISVDAAGVTLHASDMTAQLHQALDNLEIVLAKAGLTLSDVSA